MDARDYFSVECIFLTSVYINTLPWHVLKELLGGLNTFLPLEKCEEGIDLARNWPHSSHPH